jgi:hypothetical protein
VHAGIEDAGWFMWFGDSHPHLAGGQSRLTAAARTPHGGRVSNLVTRHLTVMAA